MAGQNEVKAGGAFLELFVKDGPLNKGLDKAAAKLKSFGKSVLKIGLATQAASAAMMAPLALAVKTATDMGSNLDDMAQRTGLSVESLSQLGYAAGQTDTSLDSLQGGLKSMAKFADDVAAGAEGAIEALGRLGLTAGEFLTMTPEQRFKALADGISGIVDPSMRAAAALDIFGRAGLDLLPLLDQGSSGITAMMREADALGLTVSRLDAEKAAKFGDQLAALSAILKMVLFNLGSSLIEPLATVVGWLQRAAQVVAEFLKNNQWLAKALAVVGIALGVAGAAVWAFGSYISIIAGVMTAFTSVMAAMPMILAVLGGIFAAIVSPIGLTVIAVLALGAALVALAGYFIYTNDTARAAFMGLLEGVMEILGAIGAAIMRGDWAAAFNVVLESVQLGWTTAWQNMKIAFIDFAQWMLAALAEMVGKVIGITEDLGIDGLFGGADSMRDKLDNLTDSANSFGDAMKAAAQADIDRAAKEFNDALAAARGPQKATPGAGQPDLQNRIQNVASRIVEGKSTAGTFNAQGAAMLGRAGGAIDRQLQEAKTQTSIMRQSQKLLQDISDDLPPPPLTFT